MNWRSIAGNPRPLAGRLWRKICLAFDPGRRSIFTLEDGSLFECALGDSAGRILTVSGTLEPIEREFIRNTLQPGDIFFDIGANIGLFTLVAARRVGPGGRVFAFEPSQRETRYLQRNIELNHLTNVTIVECAVAERQGTTQFAIAADGGTNSLKQNDHPQQQIQSWSSVNVTTLDTFISANEIQRVPLVKIDVEGGEVNVLNGARGLLSGNYPPVIVCEFCDVTAAGFQSTGRQLYDTFTVMGYRLFSLSESAPPKLIPALPKEKYEFENLVACKSTAAPGG
jgi:FkbM family methyltransferase